MNQWQKHLAAQEQSGKSVSAYCRERRIDPKRLYYWKSRSQGKADFVEISRPGQKSFELTIRDGITLSIPEHFKADELRRLLEVLGC